MLALAACLVVPALPGSGLAHAQLLVSNITETPIITTSTNVTSTRSVAQGFTAGGNARGYVLSSISLRVHDAPNTPDDVTVTVRESSGGNPGNTRYTLTNPETFGTEAQRFTAPSGATLDKGKTYFVVITYTSALGSGDFRLRTTNSDTESDPNDDDWSISNSRRYQSGSTWNTSVNALLMSVEGFAVTPPTLAAAHVPQLGASMRLRFNEDLDTTNLPSATAFAITAGGTTVTAANVIAALSNTVLLEQLSPTIQQGQDVIVTYTDPTDGDDPAAIQDALGNDAETFTTGEGGVPAATNDSTVDRTGPKLVNAAVESSAININLVFDETLDQAPASWPPPGAFEVTADGVSVTPSELVVGLDRVLLAVSPTILQGQDVIVTYTDPTGDDDPAAIQDALGNDAETFTTGEGGVPAVTNSSTVDRTGPKLVNAAVESSGININLVFDETLDQAPASWPPPGAFEVTADGVSVTPSELAVGADRVLLAVSPTILQGQDVIVTYTDPTGDDDPAAIQDASGNDAETFTTGEGGVPAVTNDSTVDRTGPKLVNAAVESSGININLVFDETLDQAPASWPPPGAFEVTADGVSVTPSELAVGADRVLLAVSPTILQGQDVIVTYTDPTGDDDPAAIQDASGNDAETFTTGEGGVPVVTNSSTQAIVPAAPGNLVATPGNTTITLTWETPFDGGSAITGYAYRQSTDGGNTFSTWTTIPNSASLNRYTVTTNLDNGTEYTFEVRAVNAEGASDESGQVMATPSAVPAPDAPTGFRAFPVTPVGPASIASAIGIAWDAATGETAPTGYQYQVDAGDGHGAWTAIPDSAPGEENATGYRIPNLKTADHARFARPSHSVRLRAVSGATPSAETDEKTVEGFQVAFTVEAVDAAVDEGEDARFRVTVTRSPAEPDPNCPFNAAFVFISSVSGTGGVAPASQTVRTIPSCFSSETFSVPTTDDTVKERDGTVTFTLSGRNNPNDGFFDTPSPSATVTVLDDDGRPGAPRDLRSGAGDGQVTLYWSPPGSAGRILRYEYWRRAPAERDADGNEVWRAIPDSAPGGANAERFTVTGLTNGQLHIFVLRAVNARGSGATSQSTTVTPVAGAPGAPGNLAAETVSDTDVRLSWTEPAAGAGVYITGYNIENSTDGGVSWEDDSSRTEAPSATLSIGRNATRHYRIRTLFQRGEVGSDPFARGISAPSPPVEARTGEPVGVDLPGVGVSDGEGREGVDDAVVFTVMLDREASEPVRVFYQTFDITATAGADYAAASGTLVFAPGETQHTVAVTILDDDDEDNGEFFRLALRLPAGGAHARLEREAGVGTILNSETPPEQPEPVNTPATGRPTIAGTARVGATLTASVDGIADADGLTRATFAYQWRADDGGGAADIAGATGTSYTLATADAGRTITVRVDFTDDAGTAETRTSAATTAVAGVPLTASFSDVPASHDGATAFTFGLTFSEDVAGLSYTTVRDAAFSVTNGQVTQARRQTPGTNQGWTITVEPDSRAAVTVRLPAGTVETADGRGLERAVSATVAGPPEPLTASFSDVPTEHTGEAFTFGLTFSEDVAGLSYTTVRDAAFSVTNGQVTQARRLTQGNNQGWTITVEPDSRAAVTVRLPAGAVETADGRGLEHAVSATIAGPVGIAVADARVEEAVGAVLAFVVTLERAAAGTVTVDYATADGTATAGADYTATSGTLRFAAGQTSTTVSVTVLDDAHDDGGETVTLTLSNPSGGRLTDGQATGTIENRDPLPRALLARFGRTAAVHVVEHVEERLQAPRAPGVEGRFVGRALRPGMAREMALSVLNRLGGSAGAHPLGGDARGPVGGSPAAGMGTFGTPGRAAGTPMAAAGGPIDAVSGLGATAGPLGGAGGPDGGLTGGGLLQMGLGGGDLLTGSAFAMNRETRHGGILSFWSRGSQSSFSGREGTLSLGGDVRTTMVGADYATGPLVAGLSLSHSRGQGEYAGVAGGQVASSVTGLYPWLGYKATDRITVWGVAGYGAGGLSLTPDGGPALTSGLSMAMAAAGTRGELVAGGANGFALAFKADALWVGTAIDGVDGAAGRLAATEAAVTRFRTGLEGSRDYTLAGRLSLRPSVEVGLRHDGGDAETGAGLDVGAGLVMADAATGLAVDVRVRTLLVHQAEGFRERGVALSLSYNPTPSTPLGFVARVAPSWGGQATSGAEALWGRETMAGMAHGGLADGTRLEAEVGYGLPVGRRFVGTPRVGVSTSERGRDYRVGYGLGVLDRESLNVELRVDAQRRESPMLGGTSNGVLGRASLGW